MPRRPRKQPQFWLREYNDQSIEPPATPKPANPELRIVPAIRQSLYTNLLRDPPPAAWLTHAEPKPSPPIRASIPVAFSNISRDTPTRSNLDRRISISRCSLRQSRQGGMLRERCAPIKADGVTSAARRDTPKASAPKEMSFSVPPKEMDEAN
jgi:hypothetical protein